MKNLVIIQARMGSTRLPGKVLEDICGQPAIYRMLERVSKSELADEIIVATTFLKKDLEIVKYVSHLGYRVFSGSSDDVLDRYYQAAKLIHPEYVIRLTADCPLFDWRILDGAIKSLDENADDLAMLSETFPDGEDLEIVRFEALEKAWSEAHLASEREHVTLYIKNHPELFKIQDYRCTIGNLNSERWTLDEPEDLQLIRSVYEHFAPRVDFSMEEIYQYLKNAPNIRELNQKYIRNEGLQISLKNDHFV